MRLRYWLCAFLVHFAIGADESQASTIVNLSTGGSGSANGAVYVWVGAQSTGTGVIDPFLRVQHREGEQGYNHSLGHTVPWDTKPGIHTHDIQMRDLVIASISGANYFQFLLDVNESSGQEDEFINLDNVQIFTRPTPIGSADESLAHLGNQRFNNDVGPDGNTTVTLDYSLNSGSGSGDMFMYVPVNAFAGTTPDDYVYFYSRFSNSDAGFEEWAMVRNETDIPVVPEPATMILMGSGLIAVFRKYRHRRGDS